MKYIAVFNVDEKQFFKTINGERIQLSKEEVNNIILNDYCTEAKLENKRFTISLFDKVRVKELPEKDDSKDIKIDKGLNYSYTYKDLHDAYIVGFKYGFNNCLETILGETDENN